jgi:single-strand DNA-binding protein
MPNLNSCHLIGNVTRDPEIRYTPKGTPVVELGLAINRTFTGEDGQKKQETTFVDITFWSRVAEIVQKYVKKGNPLFVEGRLHLDTWEDKNTHEKRSKLKIVGENIQLLAGRPQSESGAPAPYRPQQARAGLQQAAA